MKSGKASCPSWGPLVPAVLTSTFTTFQGVLLSPVPELRDSSKLHDSTYVEDCTFQQLGTFIHGLRDPVHNRVTLVGVTL